MAILRKKLANVAPLAATLTTLYTVPASTTTIITTINVANTSATATSFRISHALAGAADATNQYIYYDLGINGNDTFQATCALPAATTDVIRCYNTLATCVFSLYGEELS